MLCILPTIKQFVFTQNYIYAKKVVFKIDYSLSLENAASIRFIVKYI